MATTARLNWGRVVMQAFGAGIIGGIVLDLYLYLTTILPAHGSVLAMWQWVASAAIGPVALTNSSYAWLGLLVHFIVSIGWAGGYAYFAQTQNFVNTRWFISGLMYGRSCMYSCKRSCSARARSSFRRRRRRFSAA